MTGTLQERAERIRRWLADHVDGLRAVRRTRDVALAELKGEAARRRVVRSLLRLAERRAKERIEATEVEIDRLRKLNNRRREMLFRLGMKLDAWAEFIRLVEQVKPGEVRAKYKASIAGLHDGRARRYRRDLEKLTRRIAAKQERAKRPPMDPGDIALGKLPEDMTSRLQPKEKE